MNLFYGYHYPMKQYRDTHRRGGITQISLDFSSKCNYKCDWCFNSQLLNQDQKNILSLDERRRLLEDAKSLGARTLVVPGTGEPTLDANFRETIKIAYDLGMITVIYSNLTGHVDKNLIDWMKAHRVSLGIKLDSLAKDIFSKRYHTNKLVYDRYIENLEYAIQSYKGTSVDLGDKNKAHRIIGNMVLTRENVHELEEISIFCKKRDLPLFVRPVKPVDWAKKNPGAWCELGNGSGELFPESELTTLADRYNNLFSPCATLENHCAIYSFGLTVKSDGSVQICPDHHKTLFNIREDKLNKIVSALNSQRIIKPGFCVMLNQADDIIT